MHTWVEKLWNNEKKWLKYREEISLRWEEDTWSISWVTIQCLFLWVIDAWWESMKLYMCFIQFPVYFIINILLEFCFIMNNYFIKAHHLQSDINNSGYRTHRIEAWHTKAMCSGCGTEGRRCPLRWHNTSRVWDKCS